MLRQALLLFIACCSITFAAPTLHAPATARAGAELSVAVSGSTNPQDFVTIVPADSRDGAYGEYRYVDRPSLQLTAPAKPGKYEIRVLGAASPYPTLARQRLQVEAVTALLEAPAQVAAGKPFQVQWQGPNNERDYIGIGEIDPNKPPYLAYVYTREGSPMTLTAPDTAGEYELRYFLGAGDEVIGRKRIVVGTVTATVQAPARVAAGASFEVKWQGPNNPQDFITVVKAGSPGRTYDRYEYTSKGNPVRLRAPDAAGAYEVRYLTGQSYATLASAKIDITAVVANLQAPAEATAASGIAVKWQGPNNPQDYITIVPKSAREGESGNYTYTAKGNPLTVVAPLAPGEYELRYATGQSNTALARQPIRIVPGKQAPGRVRVTSTTRMISEAVEIILDASGSMLQKLGAQRRIDIAKQTLTHLSANVIPANTPFALRVFGREVDSCQTDLEIPLSPLDAGRVSAKIGALQAKNNAKTPIGASLAWVPKDLEGVRGERTVIVLTDGEETCGGDPAAAIQQLHGSGIATRVSIVGFAIDDPKLAATFRRWSDLGKGQYFHATDAASLNDAMSRALRPVFEIVDGSGRVVGEGSVGGEPLQVPAGNFNVRIKGHSGKSTPVLVKSQETATVQW